MADTELEVSPYLMRRTGGGWLAVAPPGALVSVGVTASTEEEVKEKFKSVFNRWLELLEKETLYVPK